MRRSFFILVCVLLLLMVVAAPATAKIRASTQPPTPPGTAYVVPLWDGLWVEFPDGTGATYTEHEPGVPIPSDYDVVVFGGWIGMTLGLVGTIPNYYALEVRIDDVVTTSFAQSRGCWSGAFPTELVPEDGFGPFNPRLGTKPYANWMMLPAGDLAPGPHTLVVTEWMKHPTTDLLEYFEEPSNRPIMYPPYMWTYDPATIIIAD